MWGTQSCLSLLISTFLRVIKSVTFLPKYSQCFGPETVTPEEKGKTINVGSSLYEIS
jgi:hypothetical protein